MSLPIQQFTLPQQAADQFVEDEAQDSVESMSPFQMRVHRCLLVLIVSLIFEGIVRKIAPSALGFPIFFLKDVVAIILLLMCISGEQNAVTARLLKLMGVWVLVLSPCLIATAVNDPILAVFGLKQYALYPIIVVAMSAAYLPNHRRELFAVFRLIALSVIVTTLVAAAQDRLPANHWLNLSVGGEDLSGFSAGGHLRVSSTFSFGGQYCYYLNALCFCLPVFFNSNRTSSGWLEKVLLVILVAFFISGTFLTGARMSVLGNAAILAIGGLLAMLAERSRAIIRVLVPAFLGLCLLGLLHTIYPEFFAVYETRMASAEDNAEVKTRIEGDLFGWMDGSDAAPPSGLGYGLGVMSNGSDKLSAYAAHWRANGFWTESDRATTFFEGGWYLVIFWYGLRFGIIIYTLRLLFRLRASEFRIMGSFACGFVLVIGIMGTLSIQPPLAMWWWLAVGLLICLDRFDQEPEVEEIGL